MKRTFLTFAAIAALAGYLQNSDAQPRQIGPYRPHAPVIVFHPRGPGTMGNRH